ncbi:MAG TPA: STAS domain-containing protein [Stellaceae bacterium]|jgi:anti-anti-sigma factor|nr:STAS domain-containing protein [Stellaceae bacterium]
MELRVEQLNATITRISPVGRWDVQGAATINLQLSAIAGSGRRIILDMAEVDYLSSMGMRSLVMSAKAANARGGRLVLLSPVGNVADVLVAASLDQIIPIHYEIAEAMQALTA